MESSPVTGYRSSMCGPFRKIGEKIARWLAPAREAGPDAAGHRIGLEMPGIGRSDIGIFPHDRVLTAKDEKRLERQRTDSAICLRERRYVTFQRTFPLPSDARGEKVNATFDDRLLSLRIPREAPQQPQPHRIEISSGSHDGAWGWTGRRSRRSQGAG